MEWRRRPAATWGFLVLWAIGLMWLFWPTPVPQHEVTPSVRQLSTSILSNTARHNQPMARVAPREHVQPPAPIDVQPNDARNPILRDGRVHFSPPIRDWATVFREGGELSLEVTVADAQPVPITVKSVEMLDAESGVIHAEASDEQGSHVILAYVGEAVAGTMFFPGRGLFQVRYAGEGEHRLITLEPTWSPGCAVGAPPESSPAPNSNAVGGDIKPGAKSARNDTPNVSRTWAAAVANADSVLAGPTAPVRGDAVTIVDIFVGYTPAARTGNGGDAGIAALINSAIATANTAYNNSGAGFNLRLAGRAEVSYTESGALATDLSRLQSPADGKLDSLLVSRSNYKADLCCLLVHGASDYAGIAYLWSPSATAQTFAPLALSVVVDAYADAYLTLAHEVGHNFGCGHAAGDGGGGAYSYSVGNRITVSGTQYRTVMAYAPGIRVPYFSGPNVSYLGARTGSSLLNNAQTMVNSKSVLAAIQTGSTLYQDWNTIASADLSADGKPDLIWRNGASGRVICWAMDGTNSTGTTALWSGDAAWVPMAAGDLNADEQPDLIWRNASSGRVIAWLMNGYTNSSTAVLWAGDAAWVPKATADFNADGKTDIVWRNGNTGRVIIWLMNGVTMTSTVAIWSGDPAWVPITTGDFNADSKPDIIWRNSSTGRVVLWLMNGTTLSSTVVLWSGDAAWVPIATGDFNDDGKPDIVWRNSTSGRVIIWFMNGTSMTSTAVVWG